MDMLLAEGDQCLPVLSAPPLNVAKLSEFHDKKYVTAVRDARCDDGFGARGNYYSFAHSCGMMFEAAELAMQGVSSCVPVSGFHHAGWKYGGGFCTFNGLAGAALYLQKLGAQVAVLDADMHYGNGTDDILDVMFSGHIQHWSVGLKTKYPQDAQEFLDTLNGELERLFGNCTVMLYQAGADPHVDDPLGGWLTTEQMAERDRLVFQFCKRKNMPVIWNLAGGYQTPYQNVLDLHMQTYRIWKDV